MSEEDKEKEDQKPELTATPGGGEHITESEGVFEDETMEDKYKNEK